MSAQPWSQMWRAAARDFWRTEEPARHFATSASPLIADRIAEVVREVDARLGHPTDFTVVDIGCGDGHLLALVRERCDELAVRARWIGIDLRPGRRSGIESMVLEAPMSAALAPVRGVAMAHEWLDEIPCDVVEHDGEGADRLVLVDRDGFETPGPDLGDVDACAELGVDAHRARAWLDCWWLLHEPGDRAEVGVERDRAWQWMSTLVADGAILATDYGHLRDEREGHYRSGTLAGYRAGRVVRPVPNGTVNLTAHVAWDACAAAVPGTMLTSQRDEVGRASFGEHPEAADVERYFSSLRLRDPARRGGVGWLRWDAPS